MSPQVTSQTHVQKEQQRQEQVQRRIHKIQITQSRLLQFNPIEMEQDVRHNIEDNPALEVAVADSELTEDGREFSDSSEQMQDNDYWDDDDNPGESRYLHSNRARSEGLQTPVTQQQSLIEFLEEQLAGFKLTDKQEKILRYVFGCLDSHGFLRDNVTRITHDLSDDIDVSEREVGDMVNLIRNRFEPAGIAAVDLQDCLLLQLERLPRTPDTDIVYDIVADHFDLLLNDKYDKIAEAVHSNETAVRQVTRDVLGKLRRVPVRGMFTEDTDHSDDIVPQFIIHVEDDGIITAEVNNRYPELQVSQSYREAASAQHVVTGTKSQIEEIRRKFNDATFYIEMLKMRQQTLMNVIGYIVKHQREYLLSGNEGDLHPLVLQDIADAIGVDTSTVSRATKGQYVDTPYGIKSMRIFFGNGTNNVKIALKKLIESEDPHNPLSDATLAKMLNEQGFDVSRRTVVKYRTSLGFGNSVKRGKPTDVQ